MADLGRIKRNVANMASMNAPEADIDGYIASEGVSIDDVRNFKTMAQVQLPTMPQMTDEQKTSAAQMAEQIRPKREGITLRYIGDIALSTGNGLVSGTESAVNGGTFGGYDWLDRKLGLGAEKRKEELQQQAEREGLGKLNKVMQFAAEMGGNIAGGGGALYKGLAKGGMKGLKLATTAGAIEGGAYGVTASDRLNEVVPNIVVGSTIGAIGGGVGDKLLAPALGKFGYIGAKGLGKVGKVINDMEVKRGLGKLVDILEKGEGFKDIKFGKLTADKIGSLNAIRSTTGQPLMSGERLIIPANVQKKWVEKRIKNDGLSPKELGEMLRDVFHTKTVKISPTKLPQNQALIDLQDDLANIGFVSVNPANKQSVVKSAYKTAVDNVENVLFGKKNPPRETPTPLIDNQTKSELGSHGRLTDHSAGNVVSMPQNSSVVNKDAMMAMSKLEKEFGSQKVDELLEEMTKTGRSAIEVGDEGLTRLGLKARVNTPEAGDIIERKANELFKNQHDRNLEQLNNAFGKKTKGQNVDDVADGAKNVASPIYNKLSKIGDLEAYQVKKQMVNRGGSLKDVLEAINGDLNVRHINGEQVFMKASNLPYKARVSAQDAYTDLGKYVKNNDQIQLEIKKIRKDTSQPKEVRNAKDTDFNILDAVKQNLDKDIDNLSTSLTGKDKTKAFRLGRIREALVDYMDEIVPDYRMARNVHEAKTKALAAQKVGEDIFAPKMGVEKLARKLRKMLPYERQSATIGAREAFYEMIGSKANEATTIGRILGENAKNKLRLLLGKKEANKFIAYAEEEVKRNRNMNKILSGSQTTEKLGLLEGVETVAQTIKNPFGITKMIKEPFVKAENISLAKALTEYDAEMLKNALNQLRSVEKSKAKELGRLLGAYGGSKIGTAN